LTNRRAGGRHARPGGSAPPTPINLSLTAGEAEFQIDDPAACSARRGALDIAG
jgi:hypothetical protein